MVWACDNTHTSQNNHIFALILWPLLVSATTTCWGCRARLSSVKCQVSRLSWPWTTVHCVFWTVMLGWAEPHDTRYLLHTAKAVQQNCHGHAQLSVYCLMLAPTESQHTQEIWTNWPAGAGQQYSRSHALLSSVSFIHCDSWFSRIHGTYELLHTDLLGLYCLPINQLTNWPISEPINWPINTDLLGLYCSIASHSSDKGRQDNGTWAWKRYQWSVEAKKLEDENHGRQWSLYNEAMWGHTDKRLSLLWLIFYFWW